MRKGGQVTILIANMRKCMLFGIFAIVLLWLLNKGIRGRPIEPNGVNDLLLLSNMRSGSTLLGEILRDSPGTFYVFEPLQPLAPYHYFTQNSVCRIRDTDCSTVDADERITEALHTVRAIFSCNISAIPKIVINRILFENKSGDAWLQLDRCLKEISHKKSEQQCFKNLENKCKSAQTRVAKILRLDLPTATRQLRNLPKLKIVMLYRDPRAIINSRIKTDWFPVQESNTNEVIRNINSLCIKMEFDLKAFKNTESTVRNKVAIMKTEDLFMKSKGALGVFKFMNKRITQQESERIDAISGKTLFRDWRNEIRTEYLAYINSKCQTVLESLYGIT